MAAPMRVWQRLAASPDGPRQVVHSGRTALYVDLDGGPAGCLGLVASRASRVPCALWSSMPDLEPLAGLPVRVDAGSLVVGDRPVRVVRVVDVRVPRPAPTVVGRHAGWSPVEPGTTTSELGAPPRDGRLTPADVARLLGRGPGLTPLGDDVLAGWLAVRRAAGLPDAAVAAAVRRGLGATTSLSATLLDCALEGEALPELSSWVAALGTPAEASAAAALQAVGASSGRGLLTGARLAIRSLAALTGQTTVDRPGRVA